MSDWLSARHLLAVRLDNSGDVVMLGPALRAMKETLPHVRLTLLASPAGAMAAPLLPWVDEVIAWRTLSCHPCYLFECPIGLACLDIPPEEVIETVEELLDKSEPARVQGQVSGMGGSK